MLQEFARYFYTLGSDIERRRNALAEAQREDPEVTYSRGYLSALGASDVSEKLVPADDSIVTLPVLTDEDWAALEKPIFQDEIQQELKFAAGAGDVMPLPMTAMKVQRMLAMAGGYYSAAAIAQAFSELNERFDDELRAHKFFYVRPEHVALYETDTDLFGPEVSTAFPDAGDDIAEAGKCLALRRNKAAVCHLMLAMELALRKVADKIGATVQSSDGAYLPWLVIAANIKDKIKLMSDSNEKEAWWEIHTMLISVGKAWRNPTMHPAISYSDEQAKKVFEAVKGFMHDLALWV